MAEKRGLGRGLSALMADVGLDKPKGADAPAKQPDRMVPIEKIHANRKQPRRDFPPEALQELADSIAARGVIQPLVLRPLKGTPGEYEIVAGERRWRASQKAKLHEVPAVIRELTDEQVFELALIENIQRQDLNAWEEASAYGRLQEDYGHTQEDIAAIVGKSRSHVGNLMRLLGLPETIIAHLRAGRLSAGHGKALLGTVNREELAETIIVEGLSVRQAEELASRRPKSAPDKVKPFAKAHDMDIVALERDIAASLALKVKISHRPGKESGSLTIGYDTLDDFDRLMRLMGIDQNTRD